MCLLGQCFLVDCVVDTLAARASITSGGEKKPELGTTALPDPNQAGQIQTRRTGQLIAGM